MQAIGMYTQKLVQTSKIWQVWNQLDELVPEISSTDKVFLDINLMSTQKKTKTGMDGPWMK